METLFGLGETTLRLTVFAGVFLIMALAETLVPRREMNLPKPRRWFTNLGLVVVNSLLVRFTFPMVAIGAAALAETRGWGLLALTGWPGWLKILIAVLVLDLAIYIQHVVTHKIPILWRLHQVHHADRDIDVTTGTRFHPIEIALSMLYKMVVVVALGAPPVAVLIFEVVLNAMAMFNHANFDLGRRLDGLVRLVVVTPDMHRVHHSVIREETDSNYGFNLSVWDRVFRTYRPQPRLGHIDMVIGLKPYRDEKPANLIWSLLLPFRRLR
ncbi:Fatty acid hydroxylase family (carotene hydroxylase/sterol desaturase) [hydrothermal vent metagenome]|uniref:Fatty acid hydroxylase family (Carotene hydroxylase/sterol desaturase) n=1 Tax=hydrothermal vent metagenome TaxID=652676 RepID=A0A3B0T9K0_9ZZZZ